MENSKSTGSADCGSYGRSYRGYRYGPHVYNSVRKAPVSIYKTDGTYELMVFAPGREKENFKIQVSGDELVISYKPSIDTSGLSWVRREYSRGGFERRFTVEPSMDTSGIMAKYENGVLVISIPVKPVNNEDQKEVNIS